MKKLLLFLLFIGGLVFFGCSKEDNSIVSPIAHDKPVADKPAWLKAAEAQGLQLIPLTPNTEKSLEKKTSETTKYVRYDKLTVISILDMYRSDRRMVVLFASLTIRPFSLKESMDITMEFTDDEFSTVSLGPVDLSFNPGGTDFIKPALLNVVATGLDLSGLSQNDQLQLACYDDVSTRWIYPIPAAKISFNVRTGSLICINGEIHHFSRYGFVK